MIFCSVSLNGDDDDDDDDAEITTNALADYRSVL